MSDKSESEIALTDLRVRINRIDNEILERLNDRMATAKEIGKSKAVVGKQVLDTGREMEVLSRLTAANIRGELSNFNLLKIYAEIICAARELQHHVQRQTETAALFAVFGKPIGHSLSPLMHTAAFWATGFNGSYFAVEAKESEQIVTGIKALGIAGASVTIPHKTVVLPKLDKLDAQAEKIGAVNTIVSENGVLKGYNTDCDGFLRALESKIDVANRDAVILGAGGAARAAAYGILSAGGRVKICNRSADSGERLATDLNCDYRPLDKLPQLEADILINTTPVGMIPNDGQSIVPADALRSSMLVMDLVYTPIQTRLLLDAAAAGCETIDGSEMFIHQGARQFELWTGLEAPVDIMRLFVHAALERKRTGDQWW